MPPKATPPDLPVQAFSTSADFEAFLERAHTTAPGIYVKLAKKTSGIFSVSAAEAVEVALCYGWIDGRANAVDDQWWTVRYTPRRPKSLWSKKNVGTIARLIKDGRMRPAGLAAVEAAKADGRWERAYAGPASIVEPEDFKTALGEVTAADAFWTSLNKGEKYSALWKIETASQTARAKRIVAVVQMLSAGQKPGAASSTAKAKTKRSKSVEKVAKKKPSVVPDGSKDEQRPSRRAGLRQRKSW